MLGCTNPVANNYNSNANVDDGSCAFDISGCMDDTANNYNPDATVSDDSCTYTISGCMDDTANNYNPDATVSDDSCTYTEEPVICTDDSALNYGEEGRCEFSQCIAYPANLLSNGSFEEPVIEKTWVNLSTVSPWVISLSDGLEIWKNFMGGASDGVQNIELHGDAPTMIAQNVVTVPGATYELRFDFSSRPDADSSAENNINALVDDSVLMNVVGDGTDIQNTTWSTHAKTFVAATNNTKVAFEDIGTPNSVGALMDNVVLCLVSEPEPEPMCELTLVSDATTMVKDEGEVFAELLSLPLHTAWTALIGGASWIWSDNPVADPVNETNKTFIKNFEWFGGVESATLEIASDNSYSYNLNGDNDEDTSENNFALLTQDSYDVTDAIVSGDNDLSIAVKNFAQSGGTAQSNPAGLMYKLTIVGSDESCSSEVPTYTITGYKWNDLNKDGIHDEGEPRMSGWTINATENEDTTEPAVVSDVTDEDGYYSIEVPAGSWTVGEVNQNGWAQSAPVESGTCSITVGGEARVSKMLRDGNTCNFGNYEVPEEALSCASFTSDDYIVGRNQEFTLAWDTNNADEVTISGIESVLPVDGTYTTSITSDTVFVLTASRYTGEYIEETEDRETETITCPLTIEVRSSGHGGSSKRTTGEVLGDSDARPEGEVAGASSAMPAGAPNTGAGGTSPVVVVLPTLLAVLEGKTSVRKSN